MHRSKLLDVGLQSLAFESLDANLGLPTRDQVTAISFMVTADRGGSHHGICMAWIIIAARRMLQRLNHGDMNMDVEVESPVRL